ncbi:DegT/DnrJ/EryC1/StrS aminotransferase family protein [Chromobacterium sp. IIBBL 290-4]|uniref:DegT/DnrJ/EryC1/StrS family aminotransferase n=1 Tax=Chromobacterium sp. IIBBL 290-4 TaxID=2953890 RepID=UPI0020B8DA5D|nr:DegT/DnrJ/EryC1/StrS family aminotransferase [Chromobacterium sp. IIBBL 290-4]UTH74297.1 DegT/DnrJ/EryC1/StrS family aminotransferase [Chromobacterium sp. IIBBL 290-4]
MMHTEIQSRRQIAETCNHVSQQDVAELTRALQGGLSGTADIVGEYEAELKKVYDARHAIAVSSGAAAVLAALASLPHQPGDEVIVAPTCPTCTVYPILSLGLTPVFCDVAPNGFGLDPDDLRHCLSPRTCAVIEVPMWGYPVDVEQTAAILEGRAIPLVLDLALSHLTRLRGRFLGQYGDVRCFSTQDCKFMSTGEGGFVLTDDESLAERVRAYTRFGNLAGETVGLNLKLGAMQAALGLSRVRRLGAHLASRLGNRSRLLAMLDNPAFRELPIVPGGEVNGFALLLQARGHDGRQLVRYQQERGIPSEVGKFDSRPLYERALLAPYRRDCPHASSLLRSLTTVPLHPDLSSEELDYIAETLNRYVPESAQEA